MIIIEMVSYAKLLSTVAKWLWATNMIIHSLIFSIDASCQEKEFKPA